MVRFVGRIVHDDLDLTRLGHHRVDSPLSRVFTQDFHIPEVRSVIADLGLANTAVAYQLAEIGKGSWGPTAPR